MPFFLSDARARSFISIGRCRSLMTIEGARWSSPVHQPSARARPTKERCDQGCATDVRRRWARRGDSACGVDLTKAGRAGTSYSATR